MVELRENVKRRKEQTRSDYKGNEEEGEGSGIKHSSG